MSDVHFMAPFNDYITCRTALFRIPGSDKFHGWYEQEEIKIPLSPSGKK